METAPLISILLLTSAACFLSFGWALRRHFRRDHGVPPGMRWLSLVSLLSYADFTILLGVFDRGPAASIPATTLFLSSLILFWWTVRSTRADHLSLAHSPTGPTSFVDRGPYALVRHPFYLSYLIFWTGTAIAAGHAQWLCAAMLGAWYAVVARREERCFEATAFVTRYHDYRRRTGMLFPKLRMLTAYSARGSSLEGA